MLRQLPLAELRSPHGEAASGRSFLIKLGAGLVALALLGIWAVHVGKPREVDRASFMVARHLHETLHGTDRGAADTAPQLRAPGYPLILALYASLDATFAQGIYCADDPVDGCGAEAPFRTLILLQYAAAALGFWLIYRLALGLSGQREIALVTLLLLLFWGVLGAYASSLIPHAWYQLGAVASLYLLVTANSAGRMLACGLAVGLTTLFEPTFIVVGAAAVIAAWLRADAGAARLRLTAMLGLGLALGLLPLALAAHLLGYDPGAVARHMSWALAERAAFNKLDAEAWWAGIFLPVPVAGDLARLLFASDVIDRFGYYVPGTYVFDGTNHILPAAMKQPGGPLLQLGWLIKTYMIDQPWAYVAASVPMLVRGLFGAAGLVGLVGIMHVRPMLRWSRVDGSHGAVLVLSVAAAVLLAAQTLLTSNSVHLNPILPVLYAYAIAYVASGF